MICNFFWNCSVLLIVAQELLSKKIKENKQQNIYCMGYFDQKKQYERVKISEVIENVLCFSLF